MKAFKKIKDFLKGCFSYNTKKTESNDIPLICNPTMTIKASTYESIWEEIESNDISFHPLVQAKNRDESGIISDIITTEKIS